MVKNTLSINPLTLNVDPWNVYDHAKFILKLEHAAVFQLIINHQWTSFFAGLEYMGQLNFRITKLPLFSSPVTFLTAYCTLHLFLPFKKYFRLLYLARNSSCRLLMAPRRFFLISSTASSYFIPNSIRAIATKTEARPRPVTQCTPMQCSPSSRFWNSC